MPTEITFICAILAAAAFVVLAMRLRSHFDTSAAIGAAGILLTCLVVAGVADAGRQAELKKVKSETAQIAAAAARDSNLRREMLELLGVTK